MASGTFGSVVKVSQQLLMVGGTANVRANFYLTFHRLFIVQGHIFLIGVSQARHRLDGVVYAVKITMKKAKRNSRDEKVLFSCTGNMLKF